MSAPERRVEPTRTGSGGASGSPLRRTIEGLGPAWVGLLSDWDRSLRAGNYPATTRYNYLLAASQLARFLASAPEAGEGAGAAADDPVAVTRAQLEVFQAWMIATRSASTALNKHKALQQFFKWLTVEEELLEASPMRRVRAPKTPKRLIPVMAADDTTRLLQVLKGRAFPQLRDEAIIRVLANTGARLSEVAGLAVEDVDLELDTVRLQGKGPRTGGSGSARAPPGRCPVTCGPETASPPQPRPRGCGWLPAATGRWGWRGSS